jgi:hypothetical protein
MDSKQKSRKQTKLPANFASHVGHIGPVSRARVFVDGGCHLVSDSRYDWIFGLNKDSSYPAI